MRNGLGSHVLILVAAVYETTRHGPCRSDLGGAKISGTDFSNALLDKTQQIVSTPLSNSIMHWHCPDSFDCIGCRQVLEPLPMLSATIGLRQSLNQLSTACLLSWKSL